MADIALVVMAKQPEAGNTKTRLCPPLLEEQAANLYEALLKDTLLSAVTVDKTSLVVGLTPAESIGYFREICPAATILLPVSGRDVGECMNQVTTSLLHSGFHSVIVMNSDGPSLPVDYLDKAVQELKKSDVVLGPCEDGGYYLIGLHEPKFELFQDIDWSTDRVALQTLANADRAGMRTYLLPPWYDVDTPKDLHRLINELAILPPALLPHVRLVLSHIKEDIRELKVTGQPVSRVASLLSQLGLMTG